MYKIVKIFSFLVLSIVLLSFASCGKAQSKTSDSEFNANINSETEEIQSIDFDEMTKSILSIITYDSKVPELKIIYGDETYDAVKGTYDWTYDKGDETFESIIADGLHPLQAEGIVPEIPYLYSTLSHVNPLKVDLSFDLFPSNVTARSWKATDWGNVDAESESVVVTLLIDDRDEPQFELQLNGNANIYEITATWNGADDTGGTVTYIFCISDSVNVNAGMQVEVE